VLLECGLCGDPLFRRRRREETPPSPEVHLVIKTCPADVVLDLRQGAPGSVHRQLGSMQGAAKGMAEIRIEGARARHERRPGTSGGITLDQRGVVEAFAFQAERDQIAQPRQIGAASFLVDCHLYVQRRGRIAERNAGSGAARLAGGPRLRLSHALL